MNTNTHRNSLEPGKKISSFELLHVIGHGGFGITYLANDVYLNRQVAIKEYLPVEIAVRDGNQTVHPVSEDRNDQFKWGLDRFLTEARTLAKFEHPNIVRVYAVFEENNTGYMVMAYEDGESLQQKLSSHKTLDETKLLEILIPILDGLALVHKDGFIHRDIKPDNIFIRADGTPVLLDFGSARQSQQGDTALTSLITPGYAPLEQYYSESDAQGPWTDIYGLGATLYRAVTGKPPMNAMDRSHTILKTNTDNLVSAMEICKGKYSDWFLKAIDHALQFSEEDRPQTIDAWLSEFDLPEYLIKKSISGRPSLTIPMTEKISEIDSNAVTEFVGIQPKGPLALEKTDDKETDEKNESKSYARVTKKFITVCIVGVVFAIMLISQVLDYSKTISQRADLEKQKTEIVAVFQASKYLEAMNLLLIYSGKELVREYPYLIYLSSDAEKYYGRLMQWYEKAEKKGDKFAQFVLRYIKNTHQSR